jgi:hypothetical protein
VSLGIAFKGPEGIVLAADSRVTLNAMLAVPGQGPMFLPATYDNATKVLRINGQKWVGAVTYGLGALGSTEPRTAASYLPEIEAELAKDLAGGESDDVTQQARLTVGEFAERLSAFFMRQWDAVMPADYKGPPMLFLVGGFDEGEAYGRVFEVLIPIRPKPAEVNPGRFGMTWGGQREYADRIVQGFDDGILPTIKESLKLSDKQIDALRTELKARHSIKVPYEFLSLQDCVDLAIFLVRTTIGAQSMAVDLRGVGGAIDVATITRTDGFDFVQVKKMRGERR